MTAEEVSLQLKKVKPSIIAQINHDAEIARKVQEDELARKKAEDDIASFMEVQRLQNAQILNEPTMAYTLTEAEIEHMIDTNLEVKAKALELLTDRSLTVEQRSSQLADFISMKNDKALDEMISSIKKGQKRPRQPTEAQVIYGIKKYLCNQGGWKMNQFKGRSHEEIQLEYYRVFKSNKDFVPMNSEEENRRFLRSSKKQKTEKSKEGEKLSEEQLKERIEIIDSDPSILDIEPLQIRHPVTDWEVHNDEF